MSPRRLHTCIYPLISAPSSVLEKRKKAPNAPKKALSAFFSNKYSPKPSPTYTTIGTDIYVSYTHARTHISIHVYVYVYTYQSRSRKRERRSCKPSSRGRDRYRGTLLIRNRPPLGPYGRTMPRALWWPEGVGGMERGSAGAPRVSTYFLGQQLCNPHTADYTGIS